MEMMFIYILQAKNPILYDIPSRPPNQCHVKLQLKQIMQYYFY